MKYIYFCFLIFSLPALSTETDQFTPPPIPLIDLGREIDDKIKTEITKLISEINLLNLSPEPAQNELRNRFRTEVGGRFPVGKFELWLKHGNFGNHPVRFKSKLTDSIYKFYVVPRPLVNLFRSPTIKVHGYYIGADKIGHFIQDGYLLYRKYKKYRIFFSEDLALEKTAAANKWSEYLYYGKIPTGVLSNADLAANFAGMFWYRNLFEPIALSGTTIEPLLLSHPLRFNPARQVSILEPFVTLHFNEAYNPSLYDKSSYRLIEKQIRIGCARWKRNNIAITKANSKLIQERMKLWNGFNYGQMQGKTSVGPLSTCY